jgi:hypothetical protein
MEEETYELQIYHSVCAIAPVEFTRTKQQVNE